MIVKMLNTQVSMLNECRSAKCINALNYCYIANSLTVEYCPLSNEVPNGDAHG